MSAGDNTRDDRWRPGLASSEQRVREELEDAAQERHVFSRELSFVPQTRRSRFEPYDAQTKALIAEQKRLEALRHGTRVLPLLEEWKWLDKMSGAAEKQRFLEPLIDAVRRDPHANEHVLVFLLIALEPIRRGVSKRFVSAHGGIPAAPSTDWQDRTQARTIREIEKQTLFDVTREAILQAIFLYPAEGADRLFRWFQEVAARHALQELLKDLTDNRTNLSGAEAEALQLALADLDQTEGPNTRDDELGLRRWRRGLNLRGLYETAEEFYREDGVARACRNAVDRLPRVQGEVIHDLFYRQETPERLATERKVARSTIDNNKAKALANMRVDDVFYVGLYSLGVLRDRTRRDEIRAKYPDVRLPDGRRIVVIDQAA